MHRANEQQNSSFIYIENTHIANVHVNAMQTTIVDRYRLLSYLASNRGTHNTTNTHIHNAGWNIIRMPFASTL